MELSSCQFICLREGRRPSAYLALNDGPAMNIRSSFQKFVPLNIVMPKEPYETAIHDLRTLRCTQQQAIACQKMNHSDWRTLLHTRLISRRDKFDQFTIFTSSIRRWHYMRVKMREIRLNQRLI